MKVFITGASRGIGLEFVKQYANLNEVETVYATCCRKFPKNIESSKIKTIQLDVTSPDDFKNLKQSISEIDILICNAGIKKENIPIGKINYDEILEMYKVNTLGVLRTCEELYQNVLKSKEKTIVAISSNQSSISNLTQVNEGYGYRPSKTALNMIMKNLHINVPNLKILLIHPGWVKTEMGGSNADFTTQESVFKMIKVIKAKQKFGLYTNTGQTIPW